MGGGRAGDFYEAVEIRRRQAEAGPGGLPARPGRRRWPSSGAQLGQVDGREEALALANEAVAELYRRLAEAIPAAYLPVLAGPLAIFGFSRAGGAAGGGPARVANQAVELYRRLAEANPAANLPVLAASLVTLGSSLGRRDGGRRPWRRRMRPSNSTGRARQADPRPTCPSWPHCWSSSGAAWGRWGGRRRPWRRPTRPSASMASKAEA